MKHFMALPHEKQQVILESAMSIFGSAGYKKTYVSDIAKESGISKAAVFYYFGNKKALYLYLIEYAGQFIKTGTTAKKANSGSDFFERIMEAATFKLSVMKHHPAIMSFLNSVYLEKDKEVSQDIQALLFQGESLRSQIALDGTDRTKFKDGVDPKLVLNILVKFIEGVVGSRLDGDCSVDEIMDEFSQCFNLLKNNLYREEHLL